VLDVIDLATHHRSIELKIEEFAVTSGALPPAAPAESSLRARSSV
jgi:hypothetical protein